MTGADNRRQKRLRKTKAQLVDELEALERKHTKHKLDAAGCKDSVADALLEIEGPFLALLDNSPTAIFVRDVEGHYRFVNRAYEEWYKVDRKKIIGKKPYHFFKRETADRIIAFHNEVLESGTRIEREVLTTHKDGSTRNQWVIKFPITAPDGKTIGVCGILSDLSDKERAEGAIQESEQRLRGAIDSLQEGFALYDADDRLIAFNEKYGRLRPYAQAIMERGGTFEDVLRANIKHEILPEFIGREETYVQERLKQHKDPKAPLIRRFKDGTWSMIEEVKTPDGGTAITLIDITEIKRAEEALMRNEALLRAVVDYSPTKIHIKDVEGRYTLINKEAEKLFGVTDEEGRGKTSYDLFPKEVADAFMAHDQAVIESGKPTEEEEDFELEDGVHTFLTVKFPIYDLDGVAAVGAIGTDITDRKQAEENVRRLANAIEELSENFALYDADDRLIICNESYRNFNWRIKEVITPGTSFEDNIRALVDKGLVAEAKGREEKWIQERIERHRYPSVPFEIARQDGRWLLVREQRIPDGSTVTISTDITERKRAEEALQESEERFRVVVDNLPSAIVLKDTEGHYLITNKQFNGWFNLDGRDIVGKTTFDVVPKEVAEAITEQDREVLETGTAIKREVDLPISDGTVLTTILHKFPIFDAQGRTIAVGGINTDITDRKQGEEALKESEDRFRGFAEMASDWFWEMGPDLRFSYFSPRYAEITGFPIADRIGTRRSDFMPAEDLGGHSEKWAAHLADLEARRPFRNFEYATMASAEGLRFVRVSGEPVFGADGEFLGYRGTGTDITQRKKAEQALTESQARLANILDNSPAPIYFKDTEGRFLVANKRYQEMYDVTFEDIKGKTSKEIFGDELGGTFVDHDREVLNTRQVIEREENIFGRTYLTLKFPIVDAAGDLLGLGGVETDITELKKAEQKMREAKEQAELASRAKTDFLANMSHELRTPLNSILGFSEILSRETLGPLGTPKYKEYSGDIHSSGTHLLGLINEVLDLSKLEAGEFQIIESEIDVAGTVNSCVKMVEGRSIGEMASVTSEFADELPRLLGDEKRLKQILLNLLGNAIKFTPPGGNVKVTARICKSGRHTIEISDNGVGIAEDDIPKVLEPFGQALDVHTRDYEGTGLGLYLAKSFTEMHGGTLDIVSGLGIGTTVTLRFPKERTLSTH